jgi:hypothetical protein
MSLTAADICRAALLDLNVFEPSDSVSNDDLAFVLTKLNRILDNWNADRTAVYADQFVTSTLTAALSPHLIGPTGSLTFVVTQRPVSIEGAVLIYATASAPQVALTLRDAAWYRSLSIPSLSTAIPTDLYYEPDWPNGKLYFYPVPSAALRVTLWTRIVLSQLLLTDTFTLPPGYQDALTLTLSEDIATAYEKQIPASLTRKAQEARERVFLNNVDVPLLSTQDSGMPTSGGRGNSGTYYSGWWGK